MNKLKKCPNNFRKCFDGQCKRRVIKSRSNSKRCSNGTRKCYDRKCYICNKKHTKTKSKSKSTNNLGTANFVSQRSSRSSKSKTPLVETADFFDSSRSSKSRDSIFNSKGSIFNSRSSSNSRKSN